MVNPKRCWYKQYPTQIRKTLTYPEVSLTHFLVENAHTHPDRKAIQFLGKRITYRQLIDQVYRFAHALRDLGVKKGERVAIMLPNSPQSVIAYYSALFLESIIVQLNPMYTERELVHLLSDSGAQTIICLDLVYEKVKKVKSRTNIERIIVTGIQDYLPFPKNYLYSTQLRLKGRNQTVPQDKHTYSFLSIIQKALSNRIEVPSISEKEVALLQYTGGTTGLPKGAMLTHQNLIANTMQLDAWLYRLQTNEIRILGVLPFFHVYGMTTVMNLAIYKAATMILVPRFDQDLVLKTIEKERPTLFPGAPTIYISLINHPRIQRYDLSSIEACVSGSAPLPIEIQDQFEKLTQGRLIEGYGLTETSPVTHVNLIWDRTKNNTIGLPLPDTDCRIVDIETREELQPGELGELQIRGPQVMAGYWNQSEGNEGIFDQGWLSTGDIGMMDEEGYFYIKDRKKDLIVAGGYNIYPREVEEVLYEHPSVQEAAVIGVPDEYRGETVRAYIVIKPGAKVTEEELDQYCRDQLASYKVPRQYEFRVELPKSSIGKLLRRVLQEEMKRKE